MKTRHILSLDPVHTPPLPHDKLVAIVQNLLDEKEIPYEDIAIFPSPPKKEVLIKIKEICSKWHIHMVKSIDTITTISPSIRKRSFCSRNELLSYLESFQHDYFITIIEE